MICSGIQVVNRPLTWPGTRASTCAGLGCLHVCRPRRLLAEVVNEDSGHPAGYGRRDLAVTTKKRGRSRRPLRPPPSRLAVLPGTTHVSMLDRADWLVSMVTEFLDAPMPEGNGEGLHR